MDSKYKPIFKNIFYTINETNIGGKQVVIKNNDTPIFMNNNLFFGTIFYNFKSLGTNSVS